VICSEKGAQVMEELKTAIMSGRVPAVLEKVDGLLQAGHGPQQILNVMIEAVREVGEAFSKGEAFIPEMLIAAKAMQAGAGHMAPLLMRAGVKKIGRFMIGTVAGDLHDVGKTLVSLVFQGNGFEVIDLGIDLPVDKLIDAYEAEKPDLTGLSTLLTTTLPAMEEAVRVLKEKHPEAKVIVGGAPVTQVFANRIGADGYGPDAVQAVTLAKSLLGL
jgi:5-methyltetrahydrofolate--homocysteine methyltransferase